ncbi:MAG TPA: HAD family phosphatase [Candidatus Saccharimonadales bacterium]|nr:HAD family phosphatase [Candidatus Saccharimonadales bacterium]
MIKAVLFDFGGVLTESGRSGFVAHILAELYGVDPRRLDVNADHYMLRRGQGDEDALFAKLNTRFAKQVTKQMFLEKAHDLFVPSHEVYDLAARLRKHGLKTGILSNIFAMNAAILRQQGRYEGFDPVILSCDEGHAKPDKELYEVAVQRLGLAPKEILFVDDQEKCTKPAEAIGMSALLAVSPKQIVADVTAIIERQNGIALQ